MLLTTSQSKPPAARASRAASSAGWSAARSKSMSGRTSGSAPRLLSSEASGRARSALRVIRTRLPPRAPARCCPPGHQDAARSAISAAPAASRSSATSMPSSVAPTSVSPSVAFFSRTVCGAVHGAHRGFEVQHAALAVGEGTHGGGAAGLKAGQHGTLGGHGEAGVLIVERGQGLRQNALGAFGGTCLARGVSCPAFDGQRALSGRRQHHVRLEEFADGVQAADAFQAGGGQYDGVEVTRVRLQRCRAGRARGPGGYPRCRGCPARPGQGGRRAAGQRGAASRCPPWRPAAGRPA